MRFSKIVDAARGAAMELKVEADMMGAAVGFVSEPLAIDNGRRGFQAVLKNTVCLLGDLPKSPSEFEIIDCPDNLVVGFIEGFHAAVMAELGACQHLDKGNDKYIYGESVSLASNQFVRELSRQLRSVKNLSAPRVEEIRCSKEIMERLAKERAEEEMRRAEMPGRPPILPPLIPGLSGKVMAILKPLRGGDLKGMPADYKDVMDRLRKEGKIL